MVLFIFSVLSYSSSFGAAGGDADGSVVMEMLDLEGKPVNQTRLGQVVRISVKYYPNSRFWVAYTIS